mmetsp:Transcript_15446/g.35615  ORF Transcript_15446/g.35615 Transcript_15446/m.35615 type:complete len:86 (+) Transcript_15446:1730-1987(+)
MGPKGKAHQIVVCPNTPSLQTRAGGCQIYYHSQGLIGEIADQQQQNDATDESTLLEGEWNSNDSSAHDRVHEIGTSPGDLGPFLG